MRANNIAFIKYNKLISAITTEWLDIPFPLGSFDFFKINVYQTIIKLTSSMKKNGFTLFYYPEVALKEAVSQHFFVT